MTELDSINKIQTPNTYQSIYQALKCAGIGEGDILICHSSLSSFGWTIGGPVTIIKALMDLVSAKGTIIMPAQSGDNTEPSYWQHPPVPESWWPIIRENMLPFDPLITPTRGLGRIAELFRTMPGVLRSNHPNSSFSGWGSHAIDILKDHPMNEAFGDKSPLGKLYELNAKIVLLGVKHNVNTSLHLAEFRTHYETKVFRKEGAAIMDKGIRKWESWEDVDYNSDDFDQIGLEYELHLKYNPFLVGCAEIRIHSMREMVDFAGEWMKNNRCYRKI
jgi:aminoglycoside 3-N-acetyltransferase